MGGCNHQDCSLGEVGVKLWVMACGEGFKGWKEEGILAEVQSK